MNCPTSSEPQTFKPTAEEVDAHCDVHGDFKAKSFRIFADHSPLVTHCPQCGAQNAAEKVAREKAAERHRTQEHIYSLRNRSGIPARFIDKGIENFVATTPGQQRAVEICSRFVESFDTKPGASMTFCGRPGTGKTHLACGCGNSLTQRLRSVLFMTVLSAIRHIKDTYHRDSYRSESDAIDDLLAPDLLILDEVGAQVGSEHEKMLMFEVINERYQQLRSTILISNLTREELNEFLGDRVMDRFREAGAVVPFDWQSQRGLRNVPAEIGAPATKQRKEG